MSILSGGLHHRRRRRPEINIVPLMDISVKLIFFFLVSMQFRDASSLHLTLPRAETAGRSEVRNLAIVTVSREGAYFFQDRAVTEPELRTAVAGLASAAAESKLPVTVLIRSDQETPLQPVLTAMDICRKNGLENVRLQTQ